MAKFAGFEPFQLKGVDVTVHELNYMGLKCAGKKIHRELLEQGDTGYSVHRFQEEFQLLS